MKFLVVLFSLCLVVLISADCPHKRSGLTKWSEWSGRPKAVAADVNIPANSKILLDVSPDFPMNQLKVSGELIFDDTPLSISFERMYAIDGGHIWIGSEDCRVKSQINITLLGQRQPTFDPDGAGTKCIGCFVNSQIDIHGEDRNPTWTQLDGTVLKGATDIVLEDDVDWRVGETIIIATTDFEDFNEDPNYPPSQSEKRVILARPNSKTVTVDPLNYMHWGDFWEGGKHNEKIDIRAEVGLLTRNIVIKGDISGTAGDDHWGGHVMVHEGGELRIEGVELFFVGQKDQLGRYPIHFHVAGQRPLSYVKKNAIHDTFQRCVTMHGTSDVLIEENVAFNSSGHCYFVEDGNEQYNVFNKNLGITARKHTLLKSDSQPAIFWITNPSNHYYFNHAVGGAFGFWYSMPYTPLGSAATLPDKQEWLLRYTPFGDFVGNVAHSTGSGIFIDQMLTNADGSTALASYNPRNWSQALPLLDKPSDLLSLSDYEKQSLGKPSPAVIRDCITFKCSDNGFWGRGDYIMVIRGKSLDNMNGATFPGSNSVVQNSVFVGETDNVGNPQCETCPSWIPLDPLRKRPITWEQSRPILGYRSYDAGGGDILIDSVFYSYHDVVLQSNGNIGKVRKAGAIGALTGPNVIAPINLHFRLEFYDVENRIFYYNSTSDAIMGVTFIDNDGSITGKCGASIIGTGSIVRSEDCTPYPAWNAYVCDNNDQARRSFSFSDRSSRVVYGDKTDRDGLRDLTDLYIYRLYDKATLRVEGDFDDYYSSSDPDPQYAVKFSYGTNLIVNTEYLLIAGNKSESLSSFYVSVSGMPEGEFVRFAIPYPSGTTFKVTYDYNNKNATEVNSKSQLTGNSFFYDSGAGLLWLHIESFYVAWAWRYYIPVVDATAFLNVVAECPGKNFSHSNCGV
eukprot:TRINITY_DN2772_c0_g1_i3.p1 TRINITY_DN2772_c0_g1~~TRINITY_DN2772_c0_g1_i3.p1  ORF type:complete len:904 (-),score=171.24 TRINITY_DN2772_c0_g1_i3:861-3572(-)